MTKFYAVKELKSANYTVYLKSYLLEAKINSSSGEIIV